MRLQPLQALSTLLETIVPSDAKVEKTVPQAVAKQQNEQSMAALQAMLANVPNSPTKRKPRKAR